jgi:hypothetical protein
VSDQALGEEVGRGRGKSVALLGFLIFFGWLIIACVKPNTPSVPGEMLVGLVLGTIFGQVSVAAAWCALGPFSLVRRLPLSFAWLAAIVIAFGTNIARTQNSKGFAVLLVYGAAVVIQWLLVQSPIWILVARYGLRIGYQDKATTLTDHGDRQFGIRQVMILTTIVAAVLGIGRVVLGGLEGESGFADWKSVLMMAFLVFANAIICLPVIAAALLPRGTLLATFGALLLVAFATAIELPLMSFLAKPPTQASDLWVFALINVFHCAWILTLLFLVRRSGFRLLTRQGGRSNAKCAGEA